MTPNYGQHLQGRDRSWSFVLFTTTSGCSTNSHADKTLEIRSRTEPVVRSFLVRPGAGLVVAVFVTGKDDSVVRFRVGVRSNIGPGTAVTRRIPCAES
jgi:hypothetical protein